MSEIQSETIGKIAAALVKAQSSMGVAVKDAVNPHFKSRYADLASIMAAARDSLAANGLAVIQRPMPSDAGTVCLQTMIVHSSGEWIADSGLTLPMTKHDPQAAGSAITYLRRYALAAMLGIVQDDDDGAAAVAAQHAARERAAHAASAPKLDSTQAAILTLIAHAARPDRTPDLSDKLAEDYAHYVDTFTRFAAKECAIDDSVVGTVIEAAEALDLEGVREGLGIGVAA